MKITPLDIQKKTFRTVWRGLDEAEVDTFLEIVAAELEEVVKENIRLEEELRRKTGHLEEHKEREKVLQETLLTAQRITSDIKEQARKESELLLKDAERQAEKILQDAHRRLVELLQDIAELKRQRTSFEAGVKQIVASHLKLLEEMSDRTPAPVAAERISENVSFLAPRRAAEGGEED
ncbi:MAG: DivIVA domain-containing protein [Deltaproteobacteria bacterium]|nr:DivIVA domain-containing protein [Deltaproteobacteria bacterium]